MRRLPTYAIETDSLIFRTSEKLQDFGNIFKVYMYMSMPCHVRSGENAFFADKKARPRSFSFAVANEEKGDI